MLREIIIGMVPPLNRILSEAGQARKDILLAFQRSDFPFEEDTLPKVRFDGSPDNLPLLFHNPSEHLCRVERVPTIFGERVEAIIMHVDALLEFIQLDIQLDLNGAEAPPSQVGIVVMKAGIELAIDAIAANQLNYVSTYKQSTLKVLDQYEQIATPPWVSMYRST